MLFKNYEECWKGEEIESIKVLDGNINNSNSRQLLYEMIRDNPEVLNEEFVWQIQDRELVHRYKSLLEKCLEEDATKTQRVLDFASMKFNSELPLDSNDKVSNVFTKYNTKSSSGENILGREAVEDSYLIAIERELIKSGKPYQLTEHGFFDVLD